MLNKKRLMQTANIIAFVGTIIVNWMANALPIGGNTTGALSDSYPNLFVPAGLTFSIWGVIYLFLLCFIIFQARDLFKREQKEDAFQKNIGFLFILGSCANIGWIFVWHYRLVRLSVLFMFLILGTLLAIYLRLHIGKTRPGLIEKICVHIPFSIYLGWITVATIANITALLVHLKWDGFGIPENIWAVVMICAAAVITLLVLFTRKDIAYALVVIWASLGIIIKRTNPVFPPQPLIVTVSWVCIGLIGLGIVYAVVKKLLEKRNSAVMETPE